METVQKDVAAAETVEVQSALLDRTVRIDFYRSANAVKGAPCSLLLVNDGQDLVQMNFQCILEALTGGKLKRPLIVAGIHCGPDRMNEYGMAVSHDYKGRGTKAALYDKFIITELLPLIGNHFDDLTITENAFAGFSLGGLSALDIAWNHPEIFSRAGVFSGSLWWRSVNKDSKDYNQASHRLMHMQVRKGQYRPGMKFFFQCGELDETADRNRNGVIDSIDDTIDLLRELIKKGYREGRDICYVQLADGKHDVASWARSIPIFLKWGWS